MESSTCDREYFFLHENRFLDETQCSTRSTRCAKSESLPGDDTGLPLGMDVLNPAVYFPIPYSDQLLRPESLHRFQLLVACVADVLQRVEPLIQSLLNRPGETFRAGEDFDDLPVGVVVVGVFVLVASERLGRGVGVRESCSATEGALISL